MIKYDDILIITEENGLRKEKFTKGESELLEGH